MTCDPNLTDANGQIRFNFSSSDLLIPFTPSNHSENFRLGGFYFAPSPVLRKLLANCSFYVDIFDGLQLLSTIAIDNVTENPVETYVYSDQLLGAYLNIKDTLNDLTFSFSRDWITALIFGNQSRTL